MRSEYLDYAERRRQPLVAQAPYLPLCSDMTTAGRHMGHTEPDSDSTFFYSNHTGSIQPVLSFMYKSAEHTHYAYRHSMQRSDIHMMKNVHLLLF